MLGAIRMTGGDRDDLLYRWTTEGQLWLALLGWQRGHQMARVGFRGLAKYQDLKLAELDQRADKLADRIDQLVGRGGEAIAAHAKHLDMREAEIRDYEKAAADLSNGAPPLDDSPPSPPPLVVVPRNTEIISRPTAIEEVRRGGFETAHSAAQREALR